jgi:hypothetical protein
MKPQRLNWYSSWVTISTPFTHCLCSPSSIGLFTHRLKHQKQQYYTNIQVVQPQNTTHSLTITPYQLHPFSLAKSRLVTSINWPPEPMTTPTNQIKMSVPFSLNPSLELSTPFFLTGMGRAVFTGVVLVGAWTRVSWKPCFQPSCDRHFVLRGFLGMDDRLYASLIGVVFA